MGLVDFPGPNYKPKTKCEEFGHDYVVVETTWPILDLAAWLRKNYPKKYNDDKQYNYVAEAILDRYQPALNNNIPLANSICVECGDCKPQIEELRRAYKKMYEDYIEMVTSTKEKEVFRQEKAKDLFEAWKRGHRNKV
jgi:hypothetical protein